jgi:ribosome-associated protein
MRTLADRQREKAKADADDRDLESRTDRRRRDDARETVLKDLATRLVAAKPAKLARLGLDEELLAAVVTAQGIRSAPAQNRQINLVRQHLRALGPDVELLARRMEAPAPTAATVAAPASAPPMRPDVKAWCERLDEAGDAALEELVQDHPGADRQQLRQRMRELSRARAAGHGPSVRRAEARLCEQLASVLGAKRD